MQRNCSFNANQLLSFELFKIFLDPYILAFGLTHSGRYLNSTTSQPLSKYPTFPSLSLLHLTFNKSGDIWAEVTILPPAGKRSIRRRGIFALRGRQQAHIVEGEGKWQEECERKINFLHLDLNLGLPVGPEDWQSMILCRRRIHSWAGFDQFSFYQSLLSVVKIWIILQIFALLGDISNFLSEIVLISILD